MRKSGAPFLIDSSSCWRSFVAGRSAARLSALIATVEADPVTEEVQ
jgi:hypothetical protein